MINETDLGFLEFFFHGLTGRADIDAETEKYASLDPDDEIEVKKVIDSRLRPVIEKYPEVFKNEMKKALSYCLTTEDFDYGNLYDSELLPFDHPTSPKLFFIWLWEVLYNSESYLLENIKSVKVTESNINDINTFLWKAMESERD
jgi:hypothetical protein